MELSFGDLLQEARQASTDPLTGRPYTQMRLGELVGMSDAIISRWQTNKGRPGVEALNQLCALLPTLDMAEALRALGYDLPVSVGLQPDERAALAEFRAIREPGQRETALRLLRALHPEAEGRQSRPRNRQ